MSNDDRDLQFGPAPDRSDSLGRYYTKLDVGTILVSQMDSVDPISLLDLGAGSGSLSRAALARWKQVRLLTVDIEEGSAAHLRRLLGLKSPRAHHHFTADALCTSLPQLLFSQATNIDAGVCNPPFITPKWRRGFSEIIEAAGLSGSLPRISDADAALIFLAQNLRVLSNGAPLGIILPDTLISGAKYTNFRRLLLDRYLVEKVVRLPRCSFRGTDALAHIVVIRKSRRAPNPICLREVVDGRLNPRCVMIDPNDAVERLDFFYHAVNKVKSACRLLTKKLGELCTEYRRGLLTTTEAKTKMFPVLHTSDFEPRWYGTWRRFTCFTRPLTNDVFAKPGDILLARVGRGLEYQIVGVRSGYPVLTDCLYKIRVPRCLRATVLKQLTSYHGRAWLASRAHGVGAKQLTKADLLAFPIVLDATDRSVKVKLKKVGKDGHG